MGPAKTAAIAGGKRFRLPEYTGAYTLFGDSEQGYITLLTDGVLTLASCEYDLCLVGGGQGGGSTGWISYASKKGGNGGKMLNLYGQRLSGSYTCLIATGGAGSEAWSMTTGELGGDTTLGVFSSADGIAGGTGGVGKAANYTGKGAAGSSGNDPFADPDFAKLAGGGGSGGRGDNDDRGPYAGGAGADGGGAGGRGWGGPSFDAGTKAGSPGAANTGGGGGGGGFGYSGQTSKGTAGGAGGSGVILIRWGY